ncbi:hypothetical protein K449DRAFT_392521 [Hypoxylon sp. EC38]|nr:hypothetical protein K449DRAFT_392521 [Hypoxylon sp. EC38]
MRVFSWFKCRLDEATRLSLVLLALLAKPCRDKQSSRGALFSVAIRAPVSFLIWYPMRMIMNQRWDIRAAVSSFDVMVASSHATKLRSFAHLSVHLSS